MSRPEPRGWGEMVDGIFEELKKAEIVLLFYTSGARVSDFIQKTELPTSLDRSDKGESAVVWVRWNGTTYWTLIRWKSG